jgi:hypothetical protein
VTTWPFGVGPGGDVDEGQLVGVGMRLDAQDLRHDHARDLAARLRDALDLEPELVERRDDLVDRRIEVDEVANPGERREHG